MNDVQSGNETSITTMSDTQVGIERVFDAPRELVWELYTDPEAMAYWLGPRGTNMRVEEMDLREGGSYRYVHTEDDGKEWIFFGEHREVEPPKVLESTFAYEGPDGPMEGDPSIDRVEFQELEDGRTKIVVTSSFASKEQRDAMLQSGMETGVVEGYEKLDELLARRQGSSATTGS
jgi:uncharacterized protein YndB with AHSA1/START domain